MTEQASLWTLGCNGTYISDSDEEDQVKLEATTMTKFNEAMKSLSDLSGIEKPPKLSSQLNDFESASTIEKKECIEVVTKACKVICSIVAPNDGEKLFDSLPRENNAQHLLPLVTAYAQAPTRNLKTQILRIYAHKLPKKALQELHEPYGKLTKWQIDRARAHARSCGPGHEVQKAKHHRVSLNMVKVHHFIDLLNRPYFHQDVAFGTRSLKLENGGND